MRIGVRKSSAVIIAGVAILLSAFFLALYSMKYEQVVQEKSYLCELDAHTAYCSFSPYKERLPAVSIESTELRIINDCPINVSVYLSQLLGKNVHAENLTRGEEKKLTIGWGVDTILVRPLENVTETCSVSLELRYSMKTAPYAILALPSFILFIAGATTLIFGIYYRAIYGPFEELEE